MLPSLYKLYPSLLAPGSAGWRVEAAHKFAIRHSSGYTSHTNQKRTTDSL